MLAPSSGLLRTGLALKLRQVKLATRSYVRDRTSQATGTLTSYAVAAGLLAAAAILLLAAGLVGLMALFRWVEIHYGLFQAFGAVAAVLLVMALIFAAAAAGTLKRKPPHFPTLTSRLRVAIKANPVDSGQMEAVRDTAASMLRAPNIPAGAYRSRSKTPLPVGNKRDVGAGLILVATLLGWAAVRRRQRARPPAV